MNGRPTGIIYPQDLIALTIKYLTEIYRMDNDFYKVLVVNPSTEGRFFFDLKVRNQLPASAHEIDKALTNPSDLITTFEAAAIEITPVICIESARQTKTLLEDVFSPIEKHPDWAAFEKLVIATLPSREAQIKLKKMLARAIVLKLSSSTNKLKTIRLDQNAIKLITFYSNPDLTAEQAYTSKKEEAVTANITNMFKCEDLLTHLRNNDKENAKKAVGHLKDRLDSLYEKYENNIPVKFDFHALGHDGIVILLNRLNGLLKELEAFPTDNTKLQKKIIKKLAGVIQAFVNKNYFENHKLDECLESYQNNHDRESYDLLLASSHLCRYASKCHGSDSYDLAKRSQALAKKAGLSTSTDGSNSLVNSDKKADVSGSSPRSSTAQIQRTGSSGANAEQKKPASVLKSLSLRRLKDLLPRSREGSPRDDSEKSVNSKPASPKVLFDSTTKAAADSSITKDESVAVRRGNSVIGTDPTLMKQASKSDDSRPAPTPALRSSADATTGRRSLDQSERALMRRSTGVRNLFSPNVPGNISPANERATLSQSTGAKSIDPSIKRQQRRSEGFLSLSNVFKEMEEEEKRQEAEKAKTQNGKNGKEEKEKSPRK